MKRKCK